MSAVALSIIARLREAGAMLECKDGRRVRFSAPTPLPAALLAEAREHREAIAAALTADAHGPPSAGADTNEWGFTPAERAAVLARPRSQQSQASPAAQAPDALPVALQYRPPATLPPAAAPALLAYVRDRLRCRVTLVGDLIKITPTWRCPPQVVGAAVRVAPKLRDLLRSEKTP